jgi:hypothetical protein
VLQSIFETKRKAVTGGWRKSHNWDHNLFYAQNVIRSNIIKLKRIRSALNVARRGEMRMLTECRWTILREETTWKILA